MANDLAPLWGSNIPVWKQNETSSGNEADLSLAGAQHCLILLDCSSNIDFALSAVEELVRLRVKHHLFLKTSQRGGLGVLLYHTRLRKTVPVELDDDEWPLPITDEPETNNMDEDDDDEEDYYRRATKTNYHVFVPLQPPTLTAAKRLRATQPDHGRRRIDLSALYAPLPSSTADSSYSPLELALHQAMQLFEQAPCVKKPRPNEPTDVKQIWIFTDQDSPVSGHEEWRPTLDKKIQDVLANQIDLVVWPLRRKFAYRAFYQPSGVYCPTMENEALLEDRSALIAHMHTLWTKTRPSLRLPMLLPDWKDRVGDDSPAIMVDLYSLVQPRSIPIGKDTGLESGRLLTRTHQIVEKEGGIIVEYQDKDKDARATATSVMRSRLRTYYPFGGDEIAMNSQDKVDLKKGANANADFASLILIGFKPQKSIELARNLVGKTYFCHPSDKEVVGSVDAFANLHASMLRKEVVAVGELLSRVTATSRPVVIRPLKAVKQKMGGVTVFSQPAGMLVAEMPYQDDVKLVEADSVTFEPSADDDPAMEAMSMLVNGMTIAPVLGKDFDNADLDVFWNYAERVALKDPIMPNRQYDTYVDAEFMHQQFGEQIDTILNALPEEKKAKTGRAAADRPKKRPAPVPDETGIDWEDEFRNSIKEDNGFLKKRSKDELKAYCRAAGLRLGGNKPDLVARVEEHLKERIRASQLPT